jgi:hypothetical protein
MCVGAAISVPAVAIPLAFGLHFALDSLPHYDSPDKEHTSKRFLYVLFADMAVAAALLLSVAFLQPHNWLLLIACGIACASPDLMWLPRWINEIRNKPNKAMGVVRNFHSKIQRYAKPENWWAEAIWFMVFSFIFLHLTAV